MLEIIIEQDSPLAGQARRAANLPGGVLVTSVTRDGQVVAPAGDVVLQVGDQLLLLGPDGAAGERQQRDPRPD